MAHNGGGPEPGDKHRSGVEIFSGQLGDISLGGVIDLVHHEATSGWLCVARRGEIAVEKGRVIDATCGPLTGALALRELLFHRGGRFSFICGEPQGTSMIENVTLAMLDAYRLRDRWARLADVVLRPAEGRPWQPTGGHLDEVVLRLDGLRTAAEAVAEAAGFVTVILDALCTALDRGLLVRVGAPDARPGEPDADFYDLLDRAQGLMRCGNYEAAEGLLRRALALRADDRVALQNLRAVTQRRRAT